VGFPFSLLVVSALNAMIRMNKLLSPHFRDPDEVVAYKDEVKLERKPAGLTAEVISESEEDEDEY
jgi:hypothetical protein